MKERTAFGQPIGSFQNTKFTLAEVKTEVDVAQAYVDQCVTELNDGTLTAGRGGAGEVLVHRAAAASRSTSACSCSAATATCSSTRSPGPTPTPAITTIYGGTTEVMKTIIAKSLGL